jgi:hypothetical protein
LLSTSLVLKASQIAATEQPAAAGAEPHRPTPEENGAREKNGTLESSESSAATAPHAPGSAWSAQSAADPGAASNAGPNAVGAGDAESDAASETTSPGDDSLVPPVGEGPTSGTALTAVGNDGTGVAITDLSMKNPLEKNKVAGPGVKVLPVDENGDAAENNLPPQVPVTPARETDSGSANLNFGFGFGGDQDVVRDASRVFSVFNMPSVADAQMRALDRAHDMMALHTMRLVESKLDALSVVIKPSVGTELSLELRQHAGGVEAQATLLRGDRQFLSEHWGDLQHRLEQRGIKLATLACEMESSGNDHRQFPPPQSSREEAAQQASAFAEFAAVSAAGGATARLAPVHDGWESWA